VSERRGHFDSRFGVPGKNLELVKEDWLTGKKTLTGGTRGGSSPDRPVELERKK
jgi:hypothetical protein